MDGIMVSAATGVMTSLLEKLTKLLGAEYKLQKGVKRDITFLRDELSSMNALLEKLADMEVLDPQQKEWRNQVREMSYDMEDCIDKYMHQLDQEQQKPGGIMGFILSCVDKVRKLAAHPEIVEQIQELKVCISEAGHRRKRYKLDVGDNSSTNVVPIDPRLPALYAEASSLVGIAGPKDELIRLVIDGEQHMKVVSIVGFGGLGKTTLANQVYQNVDDQFDCRAFVSVSQKPDTKKILWNILYGFKMQEPVCPPQGDEEWLINALRDFLKNKRYFIVIDDIWSTQAWKIIKCALPENICGSRILVTTRNAIVAKSCCSYRHDLVYEQRPLSKVDSESLFFRRVFGSEDECPLQLKEVSNDIIRKCGGIPLAIITMASLLTNKSLAREEWVMALTSIGSGLERNSDMEEMRKILSLSYIDLPHQLRSCLLYLSMFPEDYIIQKYRLVGMWIAEGFVKVNGGRSLKEEGECYFNELINRSMIQPVEIEYDGQVMKCRVHDMILDLIISKAVEENFITFVGDQPHMLLSKNKIRRLSLYYHRGQENLSTMSKLVSAHVRSLVIFRSPAEMTPISGMHALRALDMVNSTMENSDLRNIGELIQLRYLRIEAGKVTDLPEEIGELQYLETLDLGFTPLKTWPTSIIKLRRLKRLHNHYIELPDGLGSMQLLEELSRVYVCNNCSINSLRELGNLTKLRTLWLDWCVSDLHSDKMMYSDILSSSLGKLLCSNLRNLNIWGPFAPVNITIDSWFPPSHLLRELSIFPTSLSRIPEWIPTLVNLTLLHIGFHQVTQEMLQILGDLPSLLCLYLQSTVDHPMERQRLIICNNRFERLKVFHISARPVRLVFEAGATPKLEELCVSYIRAREVQPACGDRCFGIHHLSALRDLNVFINCEGARAQEVEEWEAIFRKEASLLPNHPRPNLIRLREEGMTLDEPSLEEEIPSENTEAQPNG